MERRGTLGGPVAESIRTEPSPEPAGGARTAPGGVVAPETTSRRQTLAELPALLEDLRPDFRAIRARYRIPESEGDDLLQDTALALVARARALREPRRWLLATYRNRCRLYWRARRRNLLRAVDTGLLEELAGGGAAEQERRTLRRSLSQALASVPARCRSILGLRYGLDCTHREVASTLGIRKESTVRQATLRCLSALSTVLLDSSRALGGN